jgi:hypothetical protein
VIDADRARIIWRYTRFLSDADAGRADEVLADLAPGLRYDQLARKAAAVAMKLDPEAMKRGKEQTRADRQRVVAGREESGNAYLSGRELAIEDALASKAHRRRATTLAPTPTTAVTQTTAMMMPAGMATPTCRNGSTNVVALAMTMTTRTAPVSRLGRPRRSQR